MSPLNHKRTTSSLAPPIFYVAKNSAIKRLNLILLLQLRGSSARGRVGGRGRFWHDVRRTQRSPKDRIQNGFYPTTRSRCQGAQTINSQDRIQASCWSCCRRGRSDGGPAIRTSERPASENPFEVRFAGILLSRSFETSLEVTTFNHKISKNVFNVWKLVIDFMIVIRSDVLTNFDHQLTIRKNYSSATTEHVIRSKMFPFLLPILMLVSLILPYY